MLGSRSDGRLHTQAAVWRPETPSSLPAGAWQPQKLAVSVRRLSPIHGDQSKAPPVHSVVEALLRAQYNASPDASDVDLNTLDGVRRALQGEPSLAWAVPHAAECLKIIRQRAGHGGLGLTPIGKVARDGKAARRTDENVAKICGGAGFPPMAAGGYDFAASILKDEGSSGVLLSWSAAARLAGIDFCGEAAAALSVRLFQLSSQRRSVNCWVMVEMCRDCANHQTCFRHDQRTYLSKYQQLKALIENSFGGEVAVERTVADDTAVCIECQGMRAPVPPVRIGAFEVYLCCPEPFVPFGSVALPAPTWAGSPEAQEAAAQESNWTNFSIIRLASKLQALSWPVPDVVLRSLVTAMPRVPLLVKAQTETQLGVPGVLLKVATHKSFIEYCAENQQDESGGDRADVSRIKIVGKTDQRGTCTLFVPVNVPLTLKAWHEVLLGPQERTVTVVGSSATEVIVSETVVQLWQMVEGKELVVYCSSPRANPQPWEAEKCMPFQGRLECFNGDHFKPDTDGCIRGGADLLDEVLSVSCTGWRSAPLQDAARSIHNNTGVVEIARLAGPLIKVALVAGCCGTGLPGATLRIDEEDIGATTKEETTLSHHVVCGEHLLRAEHMLAADVIQRPFGITSSATARIHVQLSAKRLRFVCVQSLGIGEEAGVVSDIFADLWLVGGSLEEWRCSRGAPPLSCGAWPFEGELRTGYSDASTSFVVQGGALSETVPAGVDGVCGCGFSQAATKPRSLNRAWQVVMHPTSQDGCVVQRLATSASDAACSSVWLARLTAASDKPKVPRASQKRQVPHKRVAVRSACCGRGFDGARVTVGAQEPETLDHTGVFELKIPPECKGSAAVDFRIDGVPAHVLPGGTCNYSVPFSTASSPTRLDIEVACRLWIYWVPPDDDMDGDGIIFIACDAEQVPEDACPVSGALVHPGIEDGRLVFDGSLVGPHYIRAAKAADSECTSTGADAPCIFAEFDFRLEAPHGYEYSVKEPSPLAERCTELGGCELQRLLYCAVCIGFFKTMPPPNPRHLALRGPCCRHGFRCAILHLDGEEVPLAEDTIHFEVPPRKRGDRNGMLNVGLSSSEPCESGLASLPQCLLPAGHDECLVPYSPDQPELVDISLGCPLLWIFWLPPDDDDDDSPIDIIEGMIMFAIAEEHVPDEARPVAGTVRCPGTDQGDIHLDGFSMGPYMLPVLSSKPDADDTSIPACQFSALAFHLTPPEGFEYILDSAAEFTSGGCVLESLARKALVVGKFKSLPPPPMHLEMHTKCCDSVFAEALVAINGKEPRAFDEDGQIQVRRKRKGGKLGLQFSGVPGCLLPGGSCELEAPYGPQQPAAFNFDVACAVWIYWVPPEDDDLDMSCSLSLMDTLKSVDLSPGLLWIAVDKDHVPESALPVTGTLSCLPHVDEIVLNGTSVGPFHLRKSASVEDDGSGNCMLATLDLFVDSPEGFEYRPKNVSPLAERCAEVGGCELQRLANCAVVWGYFDPLPPPMPRWMTLRTTCCGRGFPDVHVAIDDKAPRAVSEDGSFKIPRRKRGDLKGSMQFCFTGVPPCLLKGGSDTTRVPYSQKEDECVKMELACNVWVYAVAPDAEEAEEDGTAFDDLEQEEDPIMIFLASNEQDVPKEASPVSGYLMCAGAEESQIPLSGATTGPFVLRRKEQRQEGESEEKESEPAEPDPDLLPTDDMGVSECLLSRLAFDMFAPGGFIFRAKDPSPLQERLAELGGCEMERLTHCPVVIGKFAPEPVEPLSLRLCTTCCRRPFAEAQMQVNGNDAPLDEQGCLTLPRNKRQGQLSIKVDGVPLHMLPDGALTIVRRFGPTEPPMNLDVSCLIWVYWIPPDEEEEEEEPDPDYPMEPPSGFLWLAVDAEQIPDEAKPIAGVLECPDAEQSSITLDGVSMGPFALRAKEADTLSTCLLGALKFHMKSPEGFEYVPREQTAMAERCEELGGCELQRLTSCPVVVGTLKGLPKI